MKSRNTKTITLIGIMIALVTVATYIGIPTPGSMGGYIHLGTLVTFVIALKYGKEIGALTGGIGAALFDIFSLYTLWAPGTLVIRLIMGYVVGKIAETDEGQGLSTKRNVIAILVGGVILLVGYFIYQSLILGLIGEVDPNQIGAVAAFTSIPGNVVQIILGLIALQVIKYLPSLTTKKELNGIKK